MAFTHRIRVRYAEVDAQGVVFNAHWLTYADDATTRFFEHLGYDTAAMWAHGADAPFDIMVRSTTLDFAGSAGFDDVVELSVEPVRLGTSSFDLRYVASVGGEPVVTVTTTYVTVVAGEARSQPIPDDLRDRLERAAGETGHREAATTTAGPR